MLHSLMLLGLAGVALPVLAHLLSKKKYDVVPWGAMQFLELGRETRRKIRLEEIVLMFLRMGLIALIALALSRPWTQGGFLANFVSTQGRDVVLVIDGSYSMGWEGKSVTPHAAAVQWTHRFLDDLRPGDTVALLDARDQVRPVIESPTRDFRRVREEIDRLPPPSGSSHLAEAAVKAAQILSRTSNVSREIIVLTDGQAIGWRAGDAGAWLRFDDLRSQPAVPPRMWVVDVSGRTSSADLTNFSVEQLRLSRELTVPNFPVRIQTKVRYSGGGTPATRRVHLEVNGQRLSDKSVQVQLEPNGEASVEFEHRFASAGSHLVSVVLDADPLPGDNRSDAAVTVADALPVLLVDGSPHLDPTRSETFFAQAAFSASGNDTPWVRATAVPWDRLTPQQLEAAEVVVLANVPRLNETQAAILRDYVARGGGLFVAPGDKVDAAAYNRLLFEEGTGLLPASLAAIESDTAEELQGVRVVNASLELPWMTRFRAEHDGGFTEARFTRWWKLLPARGTDDGSVRPAVLAARLTTGDPLLVTRQHGRGAVVLMAAPLDADWCTLPAKADFVALLHEIVFHLASGKAARNVETGLPLVLPVPPGFPVEQYAFYGPGETEFAPTPAGNELRPAIRLDDTRLPGVYVLRRKEAQQDGAAAERSEYFVVNFDRSESDLTPLDDASRALLTQDDRMTFVADHQELKQQMLTDTSRAELWSVLLFVFVGLLIGEVLMTRRLVQGGHGVVEEDAEGSEE